MISLKLSPLSRLGFALLAEWWIVEALPAAMTRPKYFSSSLIPNTPI